MRIRLTCLALVLAACSRQTQVGSPAPSAAAPSARSPAITSADQLLAAMRDRYAGKWYRNLTFVQKSTFLRPDGSVLREETWYEAGAIPGKLRIDLGEPSKGNGVIYRADSVYSFQGGKIVDRRVGRNLLLTLGFDVYLQPVAKTLDQLRGENVNVSVLRTDTLYGKRMYVVGAGPNDSTSTQFWIEADRMLFVRLIQSNAARTATQDIRFEKYVQHGNAWVAEEVRMLRGGKLSFHEEYSNVRVNVPLDESIFIPEKYATATHWYKP